MKKKYMEWIDNYEGDIYRKCKEVSEEMNNIFPELIICKGLVKIIENGKWYQHQWLKDFKGNIIDPTAKQWALIEEYREVKENDLKPVGKCCNCGEWVFGRFINSLFCSDNCSKEYVNFIGGHEPRMAS